MVSIPGWSTQKKKKGKEISALVSCRPGPPQPFLGSCSVADHLHSTDCSRQERPTSSLYISREWSSMGWLKFDAVSKPTGTQTSQVSERVSSNSREHERVGSHREVANGRHQECDSNFIHHLIVDSPRAHSGDWYHSVL